MEIPASHHRGIVKVDVIRITGSPARMHMAKGMKAGLDPFQLLPEMRTAEVHLPAGGQVQDALWRGMSDQNINTSRDQFPFFRQLGFRKIKRKA